MKSAVIPWIFFVSQHSLDCYRVRSGETEHKVEWLSEGEVGFARIAVDGVQKEPGLLLPRKGPGLGATRWPDKYFQQPACLYRQ